MRCKRKLMVSLPAVLLVTSLTFLAGCTHADSVALEMFVTDLLRSAASALLL